MDMHALFGRTRPELTELMAGLGQKPYRARQVFEALYKQRVGSVEDITTLPQEFRESADRRRLAFRRLPEDRADGYLGRRH